VAEDSASQRFLRINRVPPPYDRRMLGAIVGDVIGSPFEDANAITGPTPRRGACIGIRSNPPAAALAIRCATALHLA